jgi:hypothetical protein
MTLDYLLFDFSDEDSGRGSFDAMASVEVARLPALFAEVATVLRWARRSFGSADEAGDEGEWDFALQAADEHGKPLELALDANTGAASLGDTPPRGRVTVTFTLSGSAAFCAALRDEFQLDD